MKKLIIVSVSIAAMLLSLASCEKAPVTSVKEFKVSVSLPEGFNADAQYAYNVTIVNNTTNVSTTVKAVESVATFTDVEFGSYTVSASDIISNEEFKKIAPAEISGSYKGEVAFNSNSVKVAIASEEDVLEPVALSVSWSVPSSLVISRVYNFGTLNCASKAYNIDKYIEIFNNSSETVYADGLYVGEAYGSAVMQSSYTDVADADVCYLQRVIQLPGSGNQYPIEPGKSIVVAQNAKNHIVADVVTNTVDLSGAEFECYVEGASASMFQDNPDVPNISELFGAGTYQAKFFAGQGTVIILFRCASEEFNALPTVLVPGSDAYGAAYASNCKALPNDAVLDAVDVIRETFESRGGKHVPSTIDAGNALINQAKITLRKIARIADDGRVVLQDTNNSGNDFVMVASTDGSVLVPKNYEIAEIQPK